MESHLQKPPGSTYVDFELVGTEQALELRRKPRWIDLAHGNILECRIGWDAMCAGVREWHLGGIIDRRSQE